MARRAVCSVVVLCLALLAACGRDAPRASAGPSITDDWGRTVALAAPARRIVSLAPATTELVFALGAGDRLVGRTTWCDFPAEAAAVTSVGNGIGPNVEAIAAQRPDLVLLYPSESNRAALGQLEQLGIAVAVVEQDLIAEWRASTRKVATLLGAELVADSLLADFDRRLASLADTTERPALRVFIAAGDNPPIAIGTGSFLTELVELAGGHNVFDSIGGPSAVVSFESIVAQEPEAVLVLGADSVAATLRSRQGWRTIRAVHQGRIITVDGSQFNRPSPRLPDAVSALEQRVTAIALECRPTPEEPSRCASRP